MTCLGRRHQNSLSGLERTRLRFAAINIGIEAANLCASTRARWLDEAADHEVAALRALHLSPVEAVPTAVGLSAALRDHALDTTGAHCRPDVGAAHDVIAEAHNRCCRSGCRDELAKAYLALLDQPGPQVYPVQEEEVEGHVADRQRAGTKVVLCSAWKLVRPSGCKAATSPSSNADRAAIRRARPPRR
jgi:hypothetical protein